MVYWHQNNGQEPGKEQEQRERSGGIQGHIQKEFVSPGPNLDASPVSAAGKRDDSRVNFIANGRPGRLKGVIIHMKRRINWKRFLSLVLLAALTVCLFASCGKNGQKETEGESLNLETEEQTVDPGIGKETESETDSGTQPGGEEQGPVYIESGSPVLSVAYEYVDGRYVQTSKVGILQGDVTTVQEAGGYSTFSLVLTDSVMSYVGTLDATDLPLSSWKQHTDDVNVGIMIAINRGGKSYLNKDKSNYDDIQMDKSGKYIVHTENSAWYMVPSSDWNDYVCTNLDRLVRTYKLPFIVLEEPEMWHKSGYSASFKAEWKEYYGTEWEDQTSSPDAWYRSMRLKTHLFQRLLDRIGKELHEKYPDLKIYIASHSTLSYNAWSITSGLDSYMSMGLLNGFIGQTWSDTIRSNVPFEGASVSMPFHSAFLDYSSYLASQYDTDFYALADPMADSKDLTEEKCRVLYLETIAAQMMQPAIQRFEIMPWVTRAFSGVSNSYKTIQMNIQKMQNDLVGRDVTLTAGTPGVTYLISDSLSWVTTGNNWAPNSSDGFYGVTLPLVNAGIPVQFVSLDTLTDVSALKDATILILTLDNILPQNEKNLEVLAQWVREGGVLLTVTGYSQFWEMESAWWDESPLASLLDLLDMKDVEIGHGTSSTKLYGTSFTSYNRFTLTFDNLPATADVLAESSGKPIAFSQDVGKGQIRVIGVSAANFAKTQYGSECMLRLTEDAVGESRTEYIYADSDLYKAERGPYVACHTFAGQTLDGLYLNLYDDNLSILENPELEANTSYLFYSLDGLDLSKPALAFTGGRQEGEVTREERKTVFTITGPTATFTASRLFAPEGLYPAEITGVDKDGRHVSVDMSWSNEYHSLYLISDIPYGGVTYTVTWGETPVPDGAGYEVVEESVTTTNANEDAEYLIENTAMSNSAQRYCDLATYLIYKFDISDMDHVVFYLSVSQNYILEVSQDGKDWTIAYDYSQGGKVAHLKNADNKTILTINPGDYGISDTLYIRLRNSNPSLGWGGSVYRISWKYRVYPD